MKTTIELPDLLFRRAKAFAAARGLSLRQFFTDAVADRLQAAAGGAGKQPWRKHYGALARQRGELKAMDRHLEREFEQVNPDDWR